VRFTDDAAQTAAAAFDAAGAELAIIYLPPPHTPTVLVHLDQHRAGPPPD